MAATILRLKQPRRATRYFMLEAWTILDASTNQPVPAYDETGDPFLIFATAKQARASAKMHKEFYEVDCYVAPIVIQPKKEHHANQQ